MAYEVGLRLDCDESELALLTLGGALHDVGKLGVRDEVLDKPGPLTAEELREVRAHPEIGARMVALDRALRAALPAVLYHHERWDGAGYPSGCSGVRDPARRAHPRRRRQLRRDDVGPARTVVRARRPGPRRRSTGAPARSSIRRSPRRFWTHGSPGRSTPPGASGRRPAVVGSSGSGSRAFIVPSEGRPQGLPRRQSAAQTSSFVRTRRMTSSVNSLVPAWPPRSAVRTPSATVSRQASRIARPATAVLSV